MIYLDYAATAPLRREALEEMLPYLTKKFGNPDSLHACGREAAYAVTNARDKIAALLGVKPNEVYFTSGGTEADNWAVREMGTGRAVVSAIEHTAVLSAAPLRAEGYNVCPVGENGLLCLETLEETIKEGTGLVCAMAVNNETGCIQPISRLAELAHAHGAYFFSDCVQAACTQDLKQILKSADGISLSAHKVGGPKGVGALVVKRGVPLKKLIAGGEQERALRGGTLNVAGIVGFCKALELATAERTEFVRHTEQLKTLFEEKIFAKLGDKVKRDGENCAPNISHLTFEKGEALLSALDLSGVAASGGAACSAHTALPSHVMLAMGRSAQEAKRGIRFSFSMQTTEEEVLIAAQRVIELSGSANII